MENKIVGHTAKDGCFHTPVGAKVVPGNEISGVVGMKGLAYKEKTNERNNHQI